MNIVEQNTTRLQAPVNLTVPSVEDGSGECGLFGEPSGDLQGDVAGVETWWYGVTWRRSGPLDGAFGHGGDVFFEGQVEVFGGASGQDSRIMENS